MPKYAWALFCSRFFIFLTKGEESKPKLTYGSLKNKILDIFLSAIPNEQDLINLQTIFGMEILVLLQFEIFYVFFFFLIFILGCGRLIVGEWSADEFLKFSKDISNETNTVQLDRKR